MALKYYKNERDKITKKRLFMLKNYTISTKNKTSIIHVIRPMI